MGVPTEDAVVIELAKRQDEPNVVTVNCPDKTGLGCDLCRTVLEFGLCISRADVSTDGRWCFVVFYVVPCLSKLNIQWMNLKERLLSFCPSTPIPFYFDICTAPKKPQVFLLKLFSVDRKGLLHDVTQVLSELELLIHSVKVSTTPDGRVMDLFFVTDGMELLHTKKRQEETCERLDAFLGESCISCEFQLADDFQYGFSSFPPASSEELFRSEISKSEVGSNALSPDKSKLNQVHVVVDNSLSPTQTLVQISCIDQKGLLYDILRTLKDCGIQIAYGRFLSDKEGRREIDLFIQQDGKKVVDLGKQNSICSQMKLEMLHPLRVKIVSRGPDTELLVANPVELSGKGRPRVFYDVTLALKVLGICIFSAEIGRHTTLERQWEVYRFLLAETAEYPLANRRARSQIIDRVRRTLMGW